MSIRFFPWYGGKFRVVDPILACVPHQVTVWHEACMGSAAVTLNAPRRAEEILSDLDEDLVHLVRLMADKVEGEKLLDRLLHTEYSESAFIRAQRAKKNDYCGVDDLTRAEMIFTSITQSFNSTRKSFRRRGVSIEDYRERNAANLTEVFKRLQGVHVCKVDCVDVVKQVYSNPHAFVFLDVPYRWELRAKGARSIYGHEMDNADHIRLLEACKDAKCCIMLCGYRQENGKDPYDKVLGVGQAGSHWQYYTLAELRKTCQNKSVRDIGKETIWVNYPLPNIARYYIDVERDHFENEVPTSTPSRIILPDYLAS